MRVQPSRRAWAIMAKLRVATWKVNSVKQRIPCLLPWLDDGRPDVVCLQETKLTDQSFMDALGAALGTRGYEIAHHGEAQWNGVAILSRAGLDDVEVGLPGGPGFPHQEARMIAATCGGGRVYSVYVPHRRVPHSQPYYYKPACLAALGRLLQAGPAAPVVCRGLNIRPTDGEARHPDG